MTKKTIDGMEAQRRLNKLCSRSVADSSHPFWPSRLGPAGTWCGQTYILVAAVGDVTGVASLIRFVDYDTREQLR